MPDETLRYDPATGSWLYPAHWDHDTTGLSAELDRRIAARTEEDEAAHIVSTPEADPWPS